MTNAQILADKYMNIPFGYFNELTKTLTAMEKKTKSVKDVCDKATFCVDDELGTLTYYYRFVKECLPQSDIEETLLKIEVAEDEHGNAVKLDDWQMQTACETILNQHAKTW